MKNINFILGLLAGVIIGAAGAIVFSGSDVVETSPTGATFNSAKVAAIVAAPATASATTTSILNSDANDRYITSTFAYCGGLGSSQTAYTGAGLANLTLKAATTSTAAPAALTNTNLVMNVNIATTTPNTSAVATSTFVSAINQRWAAGSYLTFEFNATNTAACTVGANYIPS